MLFVFQVASRHDFYEAMGAVSTMALAVLTFVLAGATTFLASYTYRLWSATKLLADEARSDAASQLTETRNAVQAATRAATAAERSADHARDSEERELRAYVGWGKLSYGTRSYDTFIAGKTSLTNWGTTPALDVRVRVNVDIYRSDLGEVIEAPPRTDGSQVVLQPGDDYEIPLPQLALLPDQANGVGREQMALFVFARVDYIDIFGKLNTVRASSKYAIGKWSLLPYGNDATYGAKPHG